MPIQIYSSCITRISCFKKNYILLLLLAIPIAHGRASSANLPQAKPIISLKEKLTKEIKEALVASKGKKLYDINSLINTSAFQEASIADKKARCLKHFISRKNNAIRRVLLPYFIWPIIVVTIIATLFYFIYYKVEHSTTFILNNAVRPTLNYFCNPNMPNREQEINQALDRIRPIVKMALAYFSIPSLGIPLLMVSISKLAHMLTLSNLVILPNPLYIPLHTIEKDYMEVKWSLNEEHIKTAEQLLVNLRHKHNDKDMRQLQLFLKLISKTDRQYDSLLAVDEEAIDKAFQYFKPHIRNKLKDIVFTMMLKANLYKITGEAEQYNILFEGVPGTGKTFSAMCINDLIHLPYVFVNTNTSDEILVGKKDDSPGSMTQGILQMGQKTHGDTGSIILDDGDRAEIKNTHTRSLTLNLLDSSKSTYRDLYFDANVPKPLFFIMTANYADKLGFALKNRIHVHISFEDVFTNEGKYKILEDYVYTLIEKYSHLPYSARREDFSDEEWAELINQAILEGEIQKDHGIRTAKSAASDYYHKKCQQTYKQYFQELENEKRRLEDEEKRKKQALEDEKRRLEEEEKRKKQALEDEKRRLEEEKKRKKQALEDEKRRLEEEKKRKKQELEDEKRRLEDEEIQAKKLEEEFFKEQDEQEQYLEQQYTPKKQKQETKDKDLDPFDDLDDNQDDSQYF